MNEQSREKTIAFYIGSLCRGGAERVIVNLAAFFYSKGYRVCIVTKLKEEDEYPLPFGVSRTIADLTEEEITASRIRNLYGRIHKLRKIWKDLKPDCIISFIKKNNFMAIASSRGLKIPVVVSVRSNPPREYPDFLTRLLVKILFPMAEGVVLQTSKAKEFFPKRVQKKSVILSNSLSEQFLKEPFKGKRKKEIVWVGRIDSNKNPMILLRVFEKIAGKYPEWTVKFIGNGRQGEELRATCQKMGMEQQVTFLGICEDVASVIRESSIFVLTSRQEGMPNALIEAMVSGLAVIATDCPCGGPAELIQNEKNGFLISVDDEDALQEKLEYLIENEATRYKMGKQAELLMNKVHPDVVNKQWFNYVEKMITKK